MRVRSGWFNEWARVTTTPSTLSWPVALGFTPQVFDAEQPLCPEPVVGHGLLGHRGSGHAPVAQAAHAVLDGRLQRHAQH